MDRSFQKSNNENCIKIHWFLIYCSYRQDKNKLVPFFYFTVYKWNKMSPVSACRNRECGLYASCNQFSGRVEMVKLRHLAKFRGNRSYRCRDIAVFTALARSCGLGSRNSVCLFVRLSVCLSATRVLCDWSKEPTGDIFIPHERAILVFWCQRSRRNSNGVIPNGGAK